MRFIHHSGRARKRRGSDALTVVEVLVAMAICAVAVGGMVSGYLVAVSSLERSGDALAAQALAMRRLEQTRAAKWDTAAWPAVDELVSTNFPDQVAALDLPHNGANLVYATNITRIWTVATNPPLKAIQVDCVWRFMGGSLRTNSIITYRRPDL